MQLISSSSTRADRRTKSMVGVSSSAWRRPREVWAAARTPSWPPMAAPTCWVADSMPRISTARCPRRRHGNVADSTCPHRRAHDGPTARSCEDAVVVAVAEEQLDRQVVGRDAGHDGLAPLDDHDGVVVEQVGQVDVEDLGHRLHAVHVEVVEPEAGAVVLVGQRERGAGDGIGDAEAAPEALGEGGLAGAQVAGEQQQVAGPQQGRERSREGLRLVDGEGPGHQHERPAYGRGASGSSPSQRSSSSSHASSRASWDWRQASAAWREG